jgi:Ca2+-binding RTX toxin-like protein
MNPVKKLVALSLVPVLAGGLFAVTASTSRAQTPPTCFGVPATIIALSTAPTFGGPGDDVIVGNGLDNEIYGNGGNDLICGGGGNDKLDGGDGLDVVFGEAGNDRLRGGDGRDVLFGNDGDDTMDGQAAVDVLDGGFGTDTCAGAGTDILFSC